MAPSSSALSAEKEARFDDEIARADMTTSITNSTEAFNGFSADGAGHGRLGRDLGVAFSRSAADARVGGASLKASTTPISPGKPSLEPGSWNGGAFGRHSADDSDDCEWFAAEEVEAAEIMYEAFRATKGPDGRLIDTERWTTETQSRVAAIVEGARAQVRHTPDELGRSGLLLHTKRDLYLVAFEGVVTLLKQSDAPDTGAILEAVKDIFKDICDDWKELLDDARRDVAEMARGAAMAEAARDKAEGSMAELYAVAKHLEEDLSNARDETAALRAEHETMRAKIDALERELARATRGATSAPHDATSAPSAAAIGDEETRAVSSAGEPIATPTSSSPVGATPIAPSTASPVTLERSEGSRTGRPGRVEAVERLRRAREAATTGSMSRHRWAVDTAGVAAAAAGVRGLSFGGSGQFGPDRALVAVNAGGSSGRSTPTQDGQATVRGGAKGVRQWSLKQLRDVIEEICAAKGPADARQAKHELPRETMHQHLYTFLNHKFGIKSLINEWATSIITAVDKFARVDCGVAVFGRCLHNLLDEEFRKEQQIIAATIRELLKAYLRSSHTGITAEQLSAKVREKTEGVLYDEEWLDIVRFMYGRKDSAAIINAVRAIQRDHVDAEIAEEIRRAPVDNNTPGTRRRTQAQLSDVVRKRTRKRVPYEQFVQVCLFHGMRVHEEVLAPYVEAMRDMDVLRVGTLNEGQFRHLCARVRPDLSDADIEAWLLELDPWNHHAVSCSTCFTALVPGLCKMAGLEVAPGAGAVAAIVKGAAGKASGLDAAVDGVKGSLGGVGHGELWNVSHEGRNFKGLTRA